MGEARCLGCTVSGWRPAKRKVGGDALTSPSALLQCRLPGPTKRGSKDGIYSPPPPPPSPPQSLDKEKWAFFGKMGCHLSFKRSSAWLEIASRSHQCRLCSWQKWKCHPRPDCLQEKGRVGSTHQLPTLLEELVGELVGLHCLNFMGLNIIMSISQIRIWKLRCLPETHSSCGLLQEPNHERKEWYDNDGIMWL